MSSCLHSSYDPIRKSSSKKLFLDENIYTQSAVLIESNEGRCQDKIIEKKDCISILKNLDNQQSRNSCLSGIKFQKMVCFSDSKPENIFENYNTTDEICNTLNKSGREISQNDFDSNMVSLMPKNMSDSEFDPNLSQSFEPWSIHRTPVKLRGIYLWSPFFKSK